MAQTYLNRRRKDYLSCLTGLDGYLEIMLDENDPCIQPYAKRIKTMRSYLKTMVQGMIEPLPVEQVRMIRRQLENQTLIIVPTAEAKTKKELCIISHEAVKGLIEAAFGQCFLCETPPNEAKKCRLRKDLLEAGATCYDNGKGQCHRRRRSLHRGYRGR